MHKQISNGCDYLEKEHVIHRDLRAANVLVDENNQAKVSDFGLAKLMKERNGQMDDYLANENTKFPIRWTAPEAMLYKRFSSKSDVWSMGVLIWEVVTLGKTPYPGLTNRQLIEKLQRGYRMPNPGESDSTVWCPANLYGLMLNCWHTNSEFRPNFETVKDIMEGILSEWQVEQAGQEVLGPRFDATGYEQSTQPGYDFAQGSTINIRDKRRGN